jgi:hypothetical protein
VIYACSKKKKIAKKIGSASFAFKLNLHKLSKISMELMALLLSMSPVPSSPIHLSISNLIANSILSKKRQITNHHQ